MTNITEVTFDEDTAVELDALEPNENDRFDLRGALLGDDAHKKHGIDKRILSDFFTGLEDLCSAILEDEQMGYITRDNGDVEPRETCDAHILLSRMVWAFEKQREYHLNNLSRNTGFMKNIRGRAEDGQEIDMSKLASLVRYRDTCEASIEFWDDMIADLKSSHLTVTGKPYRPYGKAGAKIEAEAAKKLVASINDILGESKEKDAKAS